jgi:hypothetical protein
MRSAIVAGVAAIAALTACQPNSEKTNPAVATEKAAVERTTAAPAVGANSFTEAQARDRAAKAGYASIGALTQAADGTWQGPATKDGASVTVVVDYQGNVTTSGGAAAPAGAGAMPATPAVTPTH